MPVIVTEQPGARFNGGDKPTWEIPYNIEGTNDSIEARIELLAQSVGVYDGLYRQTPRVEHAGFNFFTGTVTYGITDPQPPAGSIEYNFEIGGKTEKRFQSLATTRYPSTAVDYQGAIGVKKNGGDVDVEGVDVNVPTYSFTLKCHMPAAYFTVDRRNKIYLCSVSPVSSVPFWGFDAKEVLFKGATGGLKSGDNFGDIEFKFDCSPNLTGLSVADIMGITKDGWDYVDVVREPKEDVSSGKKSLIPKPIAVYVHRLYNQSNFSTLLGV